MWRWSRAAASGTTRSCACVAQQWCGSDLHGVQVREYAVLLDFLVVRLVVKIPKAIRQAVACALREPLLTGSILVI
jgi:hypothetical protein